MPQHSTATGMWVREWARTRERKWAWERKKNKQTKTHTVYDRSKSFIFVFIWLAFCLIFLFLASWKISTSAGMCAHIFVRDSLSAGCAINQRSGWMSLALGRPIIVRWHMCMWICVSLWFDGAHDFWYETKCVFRQQQHQRLLWSRFYRTEFSLSHSLSLASSYSLNFLVHFNLIGMFSNVYVCCFIIFLSADVYLLLVLAFMSH